MIQAPLPKPIELPKAQPKRADAEVVSNHKAPKAKRDSAFESSKASSKEKTEFDKELDEVKGNKEGEVKAIKVSSDQVLEKDSALATQSGTVETTTPKVFDPALTKDVQELINPKTTEVAAPVKLTNEQVMALANGEVVTEEIKGEIAQAMLKTPQIAEEGKGRSPAIEFAQTEIDPQLLNNEDFVAQKNVVNKKALSNAYGMKAVPQQQKAALEAGLTQSQVVKEASATDGSAVNSQQFILNMQQEQKANQTNETQAAPKVFDMNQVKSSDSNKIMDQITDYMVQAKASKEPTVNMRVNHEQLGMLDITVTKSGVGQENIAINIGAHTTDGKNFFQQNSKDLFSHMSSAGLNVTDMKVETPSQTAKNEFDFGSQSGRNQHPSDKQFGSESGQRRHEQERRQDLWKLLNQEAA
jgi:hypothetical protein